jgi:hypothetical protein
MDKQRSTKQTPKTNDRVTRNPLKTGDELRWSGRVGSSFSTRYLLFFYQMCQFYWFQWCLEYFTFHYVYYLMKIIPEAHRAHSIIYLRFFNQL